MLAVPPCISLGLSTKKPITKNKTLVTGTSIESDLYQTSDNGSDFVFVDVIFNRRQPINDVRYMSAMSMTAPKMLGPFKVLIIGDPRVGKSSFVKRYVQGVFANHYKTTIGGNVKYCF